MNDRQRFEDFLTKFQGCYQSVEVRVVCGMKDNQWRNIYSRLELRPEDKSELTSADRPPTTEAVRAIRAVLPASEIGRLMDSIEAGSLQLKGEQVVYLARHGSQKPEGIALNNYYFRKLNRMDTEPPETWEWSYAELRGEGIQMSDCLGNDRNEVGSELQALGTPYEDLGDLISDFAGYAGGWDRVPNNSAVLICAPLMVRFGECSCEDQKVRLRLEAAPPFTRKALRVGLIERPFHGKAKRDALDVEDGNWEADGAQASFGREISVAKGSLVSLFLSTEGTACDKIGLQEPSLPRASIRFLAHEFLDAKHSRLLEYLAERKDARCLELGVTWLLHLCGFSAARYGDVKSPDEIDVLAFSESPLTLLAAECTTSPGKVADKIAQLSARCNRLRDELGDLPVQPVLVVSDPEYAPIEPHTKAAEATGTAIIVADDLDKLLSLAQQGTTAGKTLAFIQEKIPSDLGLDYGFYRGA